MRITVICGAGASSTFVAMRLKRAAASAGAAMSVAPAALADLPAGAEGTDTVLLGAHLPDDAADRVRLALPDAEVILLPEDIAADRDGTRVLSLIRPAASRAAEPPQRKDATMATRTVTIASSHGLHARPAKLFAEAAKNSGADVTIVKGDGKPANAASILGVIALGADQGDDVTLTVEGDEAETVLDRLSAMLLEDGE
ncbi:HPr family phosphocarrier protein [Microbacterium sp. JB110]|nr:HPr family phosphocarrier protein [Microbacterium sp. JB110]SJM65359.1 Phosphocarrier protein of PTS system [Frigoribacterium sp. JB110]